MAKEHFLYTKIYSELKDKIETGQLAAGGKLPSEEELRQEYGVSVITVKHAMQMLAKEQMVRRIPGKGTYVRDGGPAVEELKENPKEEEKTDIEIKREKRLIGVIMEHAMPSFGIDLMFELDRAAEKIGYQVILRFTYGDRERETREIEFLMSLGVEGLIILPCHGFYYNMALLKLVVEGVPVVVVDKKMEGIQIPCIRTDNADAVFKLVDYLKEQGKTRIGMITVEAAEAVTLKERKKAFEKKIAQLRLPEMEICTLPQLDYVMLKHVPFEEHVVRVADYLKRVGRQLDGVVCMDYGNLMAFLEAAKRVGELASHILPCCMDEVYIVPGGPRYAHVKQNEAAMADKAIELLEKQIKGEEVVQGDIIIPGIFHG